MMKQGLNIKLGQSLSMTPQLQQAIRLLQLSSLELQQEIQQALESNPLLEEVIDDDLYASDKTDNDVQAENAEQPSSIEENIPDDLSSDSSWDEVYDMSTSDSSSSSSDNSNLLETLNAEETGLTEHLLWQINASNLGIQDKIIASTIIDSLDDKGFLTESLEDIYNSLSDQLLIDLDEIVAVLHYIQNLDPVGVGASDLKECLMIQLDKLYADHPLHHKTYDLLEKNLDLLEKRDYKKIKKVHNLSDVEYQNVISLLRSLNPNPGQAFEVKTADYITPDVFVTKTANGEWIATLNQEAETKLRVNEYYQNMIPAAGNTQEKKYLKDNLQNARWFIKTLQNRNSTILNVANEIIKRQSAFMKYGLRAMKPMVLKDIAEELEVHESTISRVSTQKYIHTPHGVFELKHFFSSHVATSTGGECSSTAIRAMIQQIINEENTKKPFSDNKLTEILKEQGIKVARRTVTKYREAMTIPSSRERKSLA